MSFFLYLKYAILQLARAQLVSLKGLKNEQIISIFYIFKNWNMQKDRCLNISFFFLFFYFNKIDKTTMKIYIDQYQNNCLI